MKAAVWTPRPVALHHPTCRHGVGKGKRSLAYSRNQGLLRAARPVRSLTYLGPSANFYLRGRFPPEADQPQAEARVPPEADSCLARVRAPRFHRGGQKGCEVLRRLIARVVSSVG